MGILAYTIRRLLLMVPLLIGITAICFLLMKALPGDPVFGMAGERADPAVLARIRAQMGEDRSVLAQYAGYVSLLARGEFGRSYYGNRDVFEDIKRKFPNTLALALAAMALAAPLGVALGYMAARARDGLADRAITTVSVLGISMPVFWSALLLMLFFGFVLRWLPPSGTGGIEYLALPALTLAIPAAASLSRVARTTFIEALEMPSVQVARAMGIREARIAVVHVMRNAMIPIVTIIGLDFGSYLSGAVMTETIFSWDGLGRYAMDGIVKRDYPVVMSTIIVGTVAFVVINLIVDLIYHALDPRVRLAGKKA